MASTAWPAVVTTGTEPPPVRRAEWWCRALNRRGRAAARFWSPTGGRCRRRPRRRCRSGAEGDRHDLDDRAQPGQCRADARPDSDSGVSRARSGPNSSKQPRAHREAAAMADRGRKAIGGDEVPTACGERSGITETGRRGRGGVACRCPDSTGRPRPLGTKAPTHHRVLRVARVCGRRRHATSAWSRGGATCRSSAAGPPGDRPVRVGEVPGYPVVAASPSVSSRCLPCVCGHGCGVRHDGSPCGIRRARPRGGGPVVLAGSQARRGAPRVGCAGPRATGRGRYPSAAGRDGM